MEFRYPEESKSWSEESDDQSEHNDERGSGRSYECVFCKRGFTTAQALGGHMNIHRKDRAKSTKLPSFAASASTKVVVDDHEIDHAVSSFVPGGSYFPPEVDHSGSYDYYPPSQFSLPAVTYSDHQRDRDVFGGDYNWSTGLMSNPLYVRDNKEKIGGSSEDDGLDLELRLGYHS